MKRTAAFIIPLMLGALLSCNSTDQTGKDKSLPADSVIREKKMTALLVDVHLLEGGLMLQRNKGEQDRKWSEEAYAKIFLKYHVTKSQFIRNLAYYEKDPVNFSRIYDTVILRINKLRTKTKGKN